jgi:hypothetical protein
VEYSEEEIKNRLENVSPIAKKLYYFLPEECWMTEKTMSIALKTHNRAIREAKAQLKAVGLIEIIIEKNKKGRPNPKHRIVKIGNPDLHPIPEEYAHLEEARNRVISPQLYASNPQNSEVESKSSDSEDINPDLEINSSNLKIFSSQKEQFIINLELLMKYSAEELNRMSKIEQVEFLMECGFLVLPTHYPKFSATGKVRCSCTNEYCSSIAKHPAVKKCRSLTPETYLKKRSWYLKRFKTNPDLNVGFKPYGYSVLDVDFNKWGHISLGLLQEEVPGMDETLTVASANGLHLYTSSSGFNQSAGVLGKGLDIRSDKQPDLLLRLVPFTKVKKNTDGCPLTLCSLFLTSGFL